MTSSEALLGMVALGLTAAVAFALYRWQQRIRVRRVGGWVKEYLVARFGELPKSLSINCSDDTRWPVLVAFADPRTGSRHSLRFACPGGPTPLSLLSEKEEPGRAES